MAKPASFIDISKLPILVLSEIMSYIRIIDETLTFKYQAERLKNDHYIIHEWHLSTLYTS